MGVCGIPLTITGSLDEVYTKLLAAKVVTEFRKYSGWLLFQSDETWNYQAEHDDKTCFPENVFVDIDHGKEKISNLKIGDTVLTDKGLSRITNIYKHKYLGEMTYIKTNETHLTCTADHLLFDRYIGWKKACFFKIGDFLKTNKNEFTQIMYIKNFSLPKSKYNPSFPIKSFIFSFIFYWIVPILTIDFKSNFVGFKRKINGISSNLKLLNEANTKFFKSFSKSFFRFCFSMKSSITRKTTELSIYFARTFSKLFSTGFTFNYNWWSSAFLTTIMSIMLFLCPKNFSTPFAFCIFGVDGSTSHTANNITTGSRFRNRKTLSANRTCFSDLFETIATFVGTKPPRFTGRGGKELFSTSFTRFNNSFSFRKLITPLTTIYTHTINSVFFVRKFLTTIQTGFNYHITTLPLRLNHYYNGYTQVYNITVEKDKTFFANGVLVHNCPWCLSLESYFSNGLNGIAVPLNLPMWKRSHPTKVLFNNEIYPNSHEMDEVPARGMCRCVATFLDYLSVLAGRLMTEIGDMTG